MTTSDSLQDFQDLLRDLFQFDVADLDFGPSGPSEEQM